MKISKEQEKMLGKTTFWQDKGNRVNLRHTLIFFCVILLFNSVAIPAHTTPFKKYINRTYRFSFDIPNYWAIKYSKEEDGFICVPTTKAGKRSYEDCFDGIVFRMEFYKSGLDSTLLSLGLYTKIGGTFYTSDRVNDRVETKKIEGKTWIGIYHNNTCGINCKDEGLHAAGGQCEFLYFSNGKTTICINTNGREFDNTILERIIQSFRFD